MGQLVVQRVPSPEAWAVQRVLEDGEKRIHLRE